MGKGGGVKEKFVAKLDETVREEEEGRAWGGRKKNKIFFPREMPKTHLRFHNLRTMNYVCMQVWHHFFAFALKMHSGEIKRYLCWKHRYSATWLIDCETLISLTLHITSQTMLLSTTLLIQRSRGLNSLFFSAWLMPSSSSSETDFFLLLFPYLRRRKVSLPSQFRIHGLPARKMKKILIAYPVIFQCKF